MWGGRKLSVGKTQGVVGAKNMSGRADKDDKKRQSLSDGGMKR